ncbi:response regulator [Natrinema ejinorense]|uniref:Response regulator n=1 Tax=Natrinema ejinorense TaxID=373386 RepID=A0A2A5QUX3_9EURY|nr:response regulator [Natrinema ejinorense]PCR90583.1 response regulator [Natrinema ejinorense]
MYDTPSYQSYSDDKIDILLVEDNPVDVRLTEEAFKTAEQEIALQTVTNGDDAVEFLQQSSDTDLPDLVLLDLNLPGRDGCDVLEVIRDDPRLRPLPVLMLTSSEADEDVARCYDARANSYLTKPTDPAEFISLVDIFARFWVEKVHLPPIPQ